MAEPTAEHIAEAHRIAPIDCPIGAITRIAHALAAAEARGFERGRVSGDARADRSCRPSPGEVVPDGNRDRLTPRALRAPGFPSTTRSDDDRT